MEVRPIAFSTSVTTWVCPKSEPEAANFALKTVVTSTLKAGAHIMIIHHHD
jgi:hypothetical protein